MFRLDEDGPEEPEKPRKPKGAAQADRSEGEVDPLVGEVDSVDGIAIP